MDFVLSDLYVSGKLLSRVQAERRYLVVQKLKESSQNEDVDDQGDRGTASDDEKDRRMLLQSKTLSKYKQILTLQPKKNGHDYVVSEKRVLSSKNEEDVDILKGEKNVVLFCFLSWRR